MKLLLHRANSFFDEKSIDWKPNRVKKSHFDSIEKKLKQ